MSEPQAGATANPFWTFSLSIYRSPAVQKACLELQDGSGVDVNMMLLMLYLGSCGRQLSDSDTARILAAIEPWKAEVVVPLRMARRALKEPAAIIAPKGAEALRQMVKRDELEAERLQQDALYNAFGPHAWPAAAPVATRLAASANLGSYGRALGRTLAPAPVEVMLSASTTMVETGSVA